MINDYAVIITEKQDIRNADIDHFLQFKAKENYDPNACEICMNDM